jgi:putative hydrolase of the HAD superfamily
MNAIIFDMDDTLVDDRRATDFAFRELYKRIEDLIDISLEEARHKWDHCLANHYVKYLNGEITFREQRRCRIRDIFGNREISDIAADDIFTIYLSEYEKNIKLYDDVLPFLKSHRHFKMGIITNGDLIQQRKKIKSTGLDGFIEVVVVSGDSGFKKPDRAIFEKTCNMLKCSPDKCWFIGDHLEYDFQGSSRAGMKPVMLDRTKKYDKEKFLEMGKYINSLAGLKLEE